jgi:hypothetical protein
MSDDESGLDSPMAQRPSFQRTVSDSGSDMDSNSTIPVGLCEESDSCSDPESPCSKRKRRRDERISAFAGLGRVNRSPCSDACSDTECCSPVDNTPRDSDGYPLTARRRLAWVDDHVLRDINDGQLFKIRVDGTTGRKNKSDTVQDMQTGQRFTLKKDFKETKKETKEETKKETKEIKEQIKEGVKMRLVPVFPGRISWNTMQGYKAAQLLLSCMGVEGEHKLWNEEKGEEMTPREWLQMGMKTLSKPPIKHFECGEVVVSTLLNSLQRGQCIGCSCRNTSAEANLWVNKRDEVVEWGEKGDFKVDTPPEEWKRDCFGRHYCPEFECLKCNQTVNTTSLASMHQGHSIGCSCRNTHAEANLWVNKRDVVVEWGKKDGYEVVTSPEEWKRDCFGRGYCPEFECLKCHEPVRTTSLTNLQQGHGIGCSCRNTHAEANLWVNRRDEVVECGEKGNFKVVTPPEEWKRECTGAFYCPEVKCLKCKQTVKTTSLTHLKLGTIGCGCHNKTETKVVDWLRKHLRDVVVTTQFPGPGQGKETMHFDIHLRFPDGFEVIVEVDGAQHFWENARHFDLEGCNRDLEKEEWSLDGQRNLSIIRLVQEDVWDDRNGWDTFFLRSMKAARKIERARVFHPDAPEYTSKNSMYVHLRKQKVA